MTMTNAAETEVVVADEVVRFGFGAHNRGQLVCHWLLAVCIGVSLKMTTFPVALIAADLGNNYARETGFLVAFGFTKALSNLVAGWASDRFGRKRPHVAGWCLGLVLAGLLLHAGDSWALYLVANVFLGAQQGITWTTNIFMFIDILGPRHRALASGISNSTGYVASAIAVYVAAVVDARTAFATVMLTVVIGLVTSIFLVKDTTRFVTKESVIFSPADGGTQNENRPAPICNDESDAGVRTSSGEPKNGSSHNAVPSFGQVFAVTSWHNKSTGVICLSGLVTNLVTSLTWGLVTIWGKQQSLPNVQLANTSSVFTFAKAISQLIFGHVSDRYRRKVVLVSGFSVTVVGLVITAMAGMSGSLDAIYIYLLLGGLVTGCGIGSVYCVMTGAISDHTDSRRRASAIGVYKLWRDSGYAFGGILTGAVADLSGGSFAVTALVVAALVAVLIVLITIYFCEVHILGSGPINNPEQRDDTSCTCNSNERWQELQPVT